MRSQRLRDAVADLLDVARTGHQQLHVGHQLDQRGQRLEQHRQSLARLVDAAEEDDGRAGRTARQRRGAREPATCDAVRDEHRVVAEVLDDDAPRSR